MSTMRYSGNLQIRVTYLEPWAAGSPAPAGRSTRPNGEYRCFIRHAGESAGFAVPESITVYVGAPAFLSHAVDSPEAFDSAAATALSFAHDEGWPVEPHAAYDAELSDWHIGRSGGNAWPDGRVFYGTQKPSPEPGDLPPVLDPSNVK